MGSSVVLKEYLYVRELLVELPGNLCSTVHGRDGNVLEEVMVYS